MRVRHFIKKFLLPVIGIILCIVMVLPAAGFPVMAGDSVNSNLFAWGDNSEGQLALGNHGTDTAYTLPVQTPLDNVSDVQVSPSGACMALKNNGTVWLWGEGYTTPVQKSGLPTGTTHITAISAGYNFYLALDSDGHIWAWGSDYYGTLGNGYSYYNHDSDIPAKILGVDSIVFTAISAASYHCMALDSNKLVWVWGDNSAGELGNGSTTGPVTTAQMLSAGSISGVTAISAGGHDYNGNESSLALKSDGTVWAWGSNGYGQLGRDPSSTMDNGNSYLTIPTQISVLSNITSISAGGGFNLALDYYSNVWAWGAGGSGQLGDNNSTNSYNPVMVISNPGSPAGTTSPIPPTYLSNITVISASKAEYGDSALALDSDGNVWGWGNNGSGQLGLGDTDERDYACKIDSFSGVTAVAAGGLSSLAISTSSSATTNISIGASTDSSNFGAPVTFSVTVTAGGGYPYGTLIVYSSNNSGPEIYNGPYYEGLSFSASALAPGYNYITAYFCGSPDFRPSTAEVIQTVNIIPVEAVINRGTDSGTGDSFGDSVDIDGNTAIIGEPFKNGGTGAAYIYTTSDDGATWTQQAELTGVESNPGDEFGTAVAIDGDIAVVGDPGTDEGMGTAWIFIRVEGVWDSGHELTPADELGGGGFGGSVAISGQTAVIGAQYAPAGDYDNAGEVYVYEQQGSEWSPTDEIEESNPGAFDYFGCSIAISADTMVIGSKGTAASSGDFTAHGIAYVYQKGDSQWFPEAALQGNNLGYPAWVVDEAFGSSVAIDGNTIVVGDPDNNALDSTAGAAFVFALSDGNWTQTSELMASDNNDGAAFGGSVAVSGGTILIGAQTNYVGYSSFGFQAAGSAYLFTTQNSGETWEQQAEYVEPESDFPSSDDYFGTSVSLSNGLCLAGAPGKTVKLEDSNIGGAGEVYVFSGTGIATTSLPDGRLTSVYGPFQLQAFGGSGDFSWSYDYMHSSWPAGLNLAADGIISGTPTRSGNYYVSIIAYDNVTGLEYTKDYYILIHAAVRIMTGWLPDGVTGTPYSQTLQATRGVTPYNWELTGDTHLPSGLILSGDNFDTISGTPTAVGTYNFTVQVTDGVNMADTQELTINVTAPTPTIVTTGLLPGIKNSYYQQALESIYDNGSPVWTTYSGSLPPGIGLSSSGIISGTPTASGKYLFTVQLASGTYNITRKFSIQINDGGSVWGWGYNADAELGNGAPGDGAISSTPVQTSGLTNAVVIGRSNAVDILGQVWSWGTGGNAQLGQGTNWTSYVPGQVVEQSGDGYAPITNMVSVDTGEMSSMVIDAQGNLWAWGDNQEGQLGIGTDWTTQFARNYAGLVPGLTNVIGASTYEYHDLAVESDGTVWAWGYSSDGEIGNGDYGFTDYGMQMYVTTPTRVQNITGAIAVAAGSAFSLALDKDGHVWGWGYNYSGQLGPENLSSTIPIPVQINGLENIVAIAAGSDFCLALDKDGHVWAWGSNYYGQLGLGYYTPSIITTPQEVIGGSGIGLLSGITSIAAGDGHSLASDVNGNVWVWGSDYYGQLGDGQSGSSIERNTPYKLTGISNVVQVTASRLYSLALVQANRPPVAVADSYSTNENAALTVNAASGLFANDSDPDGDALMLDSTRTTGLQGSVTVQNDGSFTYTPPTRYAGTTSFDYRVKDIHGSTTGWTTVTINVVTTTLQPATGLSASDIDSINSGVDGRDFHVVWTPSISSGVTEQWIYVLPEGVAINTGTQTASATFSNNTTSSWTGTASLTVDSAGSTLTSGNYRIYVVSVRLTTTPSMIQTSTGMTAVGEAPYTTTTSTSASPPVIYAITANAGGGGGISPSGSAAVVATGGQTFTITPNTGYEIASINVDGSSVGAVTSYMFTNVVANHTISATFKIRTFTVTATGGTGGTITLSGAVTVPYGADQTFTISPATGYQVANIEIDGSSQGAVTSYTFHNLIADHTIDASFSLIPVTSTTETTTTTTGSTTVTSTSTTLTPPPATTTVTGTAAVETSQDVLLESADQNATVNISAGTEVTDANGQPIAGEITVTELSVPPAGAPAGENIVSVPYEFEPSGAHFSPPLLMTFNCDPNTINPVIAYWSVSQGQWITVGGVVDAINHTITVQVDHFTTFAVLAQLAVTTTTTTTNTSAQTTTNISPNTSTNTQSQTTTTATTTGSPNGTGWIVWVLIGAVVVVALVVGIIISTRRR